MLNNKGPLMFINTVNTQIEDTNEQKLFDSRDNHSKKTSKNLITNSMVTNLANSPKEEFPSNDKIKPKFIEERKINNLIEMYHKDRPVLCNLISKDSEIIGIPFKLDDTFLYIKTSEDKSSVIKLEELIDIIIIKF